MFVTLTVGNCRHFRIRGQPGGPCDTRREPSNDFDSVVQVNDENLVETSLFLFAIDNALCAHT